MEYSKYQKAIFSWIKSGKGNAVIEAVAGSGKTTTIVEALNIIPSNETKCFLAFNKSIVEELKKRVKAPKTIVQTLHSAGFKALIQTYRSKVDNYKYKSFLNENLFTLSNYITVDNLDSEITEFKARTNKLFELSCSALTSNKDDIANLAISHDIDILGDEIDVVLKMQEWGVKETSKVSFTDMLYLPVVKNLRMPTYDWLLIDEAQDLSPVQLKLLTLLMTPQSRFIAVGDEKQAIYFFRGADANSFAKLKAMPNTTTLPLSLCYRCDKNIIKFVKDNHLHNTIEAREDAAPGTVQVIDNIDLAKINANDSMILSRVNAPLTSLVLKFLSRGVAAYIKGREIGMNLINLIKRTKQVELEPMFERLSNELYKTQIKLSKKYNISLEEAKDNPAYINLEDKINCINNLSIGCANVKELIDEIISIFKDNSHGICLSSIHRGKGLQSDNIYVIALDKLPLKKALNNPIQAQQEYNLQYVCYTRAKHNLFLVNDYSRFKNE